MRKSELREWSFAYCPVIGMLLGKLQDSQMVLSAFQENQTTGAWVVLTYSSPKTVWFGLRPPGAGLTSITASIYTKASASNDGPPHSGDFYAGHAISECFFFFFFLGKLKQHNWRLPVRRESDGSRDMLMAFLALGEVDL